MTRLPPSSIHFMDASKEPGLLSPSSYERDVIEAFSTKSDNLKVQVVEKGGLLYTLNNSTLDLCRTLEERGYLAKVKVDIIRCSDVPTPLLSLMNPPTGETLISKRLFLQKFHFIVAKQYKGAAPKGYHRVPKDDEKEDAGDDNENEDDDDNDDDDDDDDDSDGSFTISDSEAEFEDSDFNGELSTGEDNGSENDSLL
ncbi:DgyrCDS7838 [Dimorphilus gyrociliatus]|uniref:DgyrCDS7838 n=1 Tax=Dimorphilus gyrociliatus TaxID=2664684 RepID=A0A7I8VX80_9ANNE|nr:DgyrCDS7838 [Dimorphilus gyrociliatus]